jgi:predicted secreted Zn-dependent protease
LRKLAHRQEIITEIKQEQEAEQLNSPVSAAKPGNSRDTAKKASPSTPAVVARSDQAQLEQDRIKKAAEREKRRAMVRAMVLERMRNPVGGMFE